MTKFERRWLAEATRLIEAANGPADDHQAVAAANAAGGDLEERILLRAEMLGVASGLAPLVGEWGVWLRRASWLFVLLAVVSGFGAASAVLGGPVVNVTWALSTLLGLNFIMLVVWAIGFFAPVARGSGASGGLLGSVWRWLVLRNWSKDARSPFVARSLLGLLADHRILRWQFATLTHKGWTALMAGAVLGLLVSFAFRRFDFSWETTILPASVFDWLLTALSALPAQIGFPLVDEAMVKAASARTTNAAERNLWAAWLVGCVICYGLLPRFLLWGLCGLRLRRESARVRLDLARPAYMALRERMMPLKAHIGVTDEAPQALDTPQLASSARSDASAAPALVAVEMHQPDWPPALPPGCVDLGRVDDRSQRRAVLDSLAQTPPVRLLVAVDPTLSPDRGTFALVTDFAAVSGACRVWLVGAAAARDGVRLQHWHDGLHETGLAADDIYADAATALAWLEHGK